MTTNDLSYPVLLIDKKGYMWVAADEDTLTTCTSRDLKMRWYEGMVIVDSSSRSFHVSEARFISGKGSFWGYTVSLDRIVNVELVLDGKAQEMEFERLKARILAYMRKIGNSMDPDYAQSVLNETKNSSNISSLINILQPYSDLRRLYTRLKPNCFV